MQILKFKYYKNWLLNNEIILKSQQKFKSEAHNIYIEEINKTERDGNDKWLQYFGRIRSYPMVKVLRKYAKQSC